MRLAVRPGSRLSGATEVPGDKSISHRWLILASTARGRSRLVGLPPSLDVRSTARCLSQIVPQARPVLNAAADNDAASVEAGGCTWNPGTSETDHPTLEVEVQGRGGLTRSTEPLDCGNSGTTMRLLVGVLASAPFTSQLVGDQSLSGRPMERIARPLGQMGARIETEQGHAPVTVRGGALHGITFSAQVPSAQVKGSLLLAGLDAAGTTVVHEPVPTRDHTERALQALGAPVVLQEGRVSVRRYQHEGFSGTAPGDPSAAAFVIAAAALTGSALEVRGVGLNPSRLRFLDVLGRMGVRTERRVERVELGEPVGDLFVHPCDGVVPVTVGSDELPLVVDEVPVLAALASHAHGGSRFSGGGELRLKESDRLAAIADGLRGLGGTADDEGTDLLVAGGGLSGGRADARGDHRIALALAVAALAAPGPSEIDGFEHVDVSFPGAASTLRRLGADVEVA